MASTSNFLSTVDLESGGLRNRTPSRAGSVESLLLVEEQGSDDRNSTRASEDGVAGGASSTGHSRALSSQASTLCGGSARTSECGESRRTQEDPAGHHESTSSISSDKTFVGDGRSPFKWGILKLPRRPSFSLVKATTSTIGSAATQVAKPLAKVQKPARYRSYIVDHVEGVCENAFVATPGLQLCRHGPPAEVHPRACEGSAHVRRSFPSDQLSAGCRLGDPRGQRGCVAPPMLAMPPNNTP